MLARNEIHVANYYFRRGAYMAALNRGKYVVEHMQQTPSVADGLAIMGQAYLLLGLDDLAEDSIACCAKTIPTTLTSPPDASSIASTPWTGCKGPGLIEQRSVCLIPLSRRNSTIDLRS